MALPLLAMSATAYSNDSLDRRFSPAGRTICAGRTDRDEPAGRISSPVCIATYLQQLRQQTHAPRPARPALMQQAERGSGPPLAFIAVVLSNFSRGQPIQEHSER